MVRTHVLAMDSAKKSLNAKVDLPFDDYCAYFAFMLFNLLKMPIWMEIYHSQASPVTYGPKTRTRYLPDTLSYVSEVVPLDSPVCGVQKRVHIDRSFGRSKSEPRYARQRWNRVSDTDPRPDPTRDASDP